MSDDYFDLYVWYEEDGSIFGFQLCYERLGDERALTWTPQQGFRHSAVDSGEQSPMTNMAPVLRPGGEFPAEKVMEEFRARSSQIAAPTREWILSKLSEYAGDR